MEEIDKEIQNKIQDFNLAIGDEILEEEGINKARVKEDEVPLEHIKFCNGQLQIEIYSNKCTLQEIKFVLFDIIDKSDVKKINDKPYLG